MTEPMKKEDIDRLKQLIELTTEQGDLEIIKNRLYRQDMEFITELELKTAIKKQERAIKPRNKFFDMLTRMGKGITGELTSMGENLNANLEKKTQEEKKK